MDVEKTSANIATGSIPSSAILPSSKSESREPPSRTNTESDITSLRDDHNGRMAYGSAAVEVDSRPEAISTSQDITTTTTTSRIGPDASTHNASSTTEPSPALNLTLMLSSGARHPYRIDEKYLLKRNVNIPGTLPTTTTDGGRGRKDPASISVYTLKELILREWREEWETQPSSPGSIRLIYFGRMLGDKEALKDCKFHASNPNIVHMAVKPPDMVEEDENAKGKGAERMEENRTNGCHCCLVM